MEEKDLEQLGKDQEETKLTWKEELAMQEEAEETLDQKIERRLEELNHKRKQEKEEQQPKKRALWSNKKIKKFLTVRIYQINLW